ncbi:indole-3-glycerol phosphate synthase TrpC [bacterium]|nr:indole-3-glycerol phosphate synthase TrpC [bacterium]
MTGATDARRAGRADVLTRLAQTARERVAAAEAREPTAAVAARARELAEREREARGAGRGDAETPAFPFEAALATPGLSFVCECKRASPSRGVIARDYDPVAIARDYEAGGAAAVSCLTEPSRFLGSLDDLTRVAAATRVPVLRKDFVVAERMVCEAKLAGAAAVLLVVAILSDDELARLVACAHELGLSALVEAYEPDEIPRAIAAGARVVGVNNRDLRTFEVDFGRSVALRDMVGPDRLFMSESGVRTADDVRRLADAGVDAVLVGEALMRAPDRRAALAELRGGAR